MEPPGAIPPDRDKQLVVHQQPNINLPTTQQQQHNSSLTGISATGQQGLERLSRPMAFDKMEILVREMQDSENGVPVRQQKMFLTSIPYAFMGYDLIEWLMDRLSIEESEALNLANQLCLHGYFFPVNDTKTLVVKDDSSLYRFQTPYYWPWQHKAPDNVEYAIYLNKRSLRNKQRHGLEDYESDALASLHKNLKGKWEIISMQAEEQVRLAKERKKGDKIVGDSQERAYWRVHRPPPGLFTPLEPCPVPSRDRQGIKPKKRTIEDWQREVEYLNKSLGRTRMKMSQACESLVQYWETFTEYDFFLQPVLPSNPWVSEDTTFWQLNNSIVDIPTEKRVKRWAISIEELVSDPTGLQEFTTFLEKEYSHENIRFWIAVNKLRRSGHSQVTKKVNEIYEEFLKPGAPCEINIDSKTMEIVQKELKNPTRFTFDAAAEHIYMLLLKKDCYPRFIRSEHYKSLLASGIQPAHKKRFFGFGGVAKKKSSTASAPNTSLLAQSSGISGVPPPGNLSRRRGSDRSLTGSAHELAIIGVKDVSSKVPHSHSQSNLSEIPYSVTVYRGDMPTDALVMTIGMKDTRTPTTGTDDVCSKKSIQEGSKSLSERLESTAEMGASVVCPWETSEPVESSVFLSVCPWEETESPKSSTKQPKSSSTPSQISEVSERMRLSCGLRQNTLDSDFHSTKRLLPHVTEQRRASMTMAPRVSEFQLGQQRPSGGRAATTPSPTGLNYGEERQQPKDFCPLVKNASCESRDEVSLMKSLTISEECTESNENSRDNKMSVISTKITIDDKYNVDELRTINPCNIESSVNINIKESVTLSLNIDNSCEKLSSTSQGTTPTINVSTVGESDDSPDEQMSKGAITAKNMSTEVQQCIDKSDNDKVEKDTGTVSDTSPQDDQKQQPEVDVIAERRESGQSDKQESRKFQKNLDTVSIVVEKCSKCEEIVQVSEISTSAPDDHVKVSLSIREIELRGGMIQDSELSPTADEYQECAQFGEEVEDYEYDVDGVETNIAPGCVAPAPTPAPSMAPLAEIESDPVDDEPDIDVQETVIEPKPETSEVKKKRKKRDSDARKLDEKEALASASQSKSASEEANRNAVCPWEDEDVSASDTTFVKTYATLGYL